MKLIRFGKSGQEKPGVELPDGKRIDTSAFGEDYTEQFFTNNGITRLAEWLKSNQSACPAVDASERLGAPPGPSFKNCVHRFKLCRPC